MVDFKDKHRKSAGQAQSVIYRRKKRKDCVRMRESKTEDVASALLHSQDAARRSKSLPRIRTRYVVIIVIIVLLCVALGIAHLMGAFAKETGEVLIPPNPIKPLPPSRSLLQVFSKVAVCADGAVCAEIGKSILVKNGSAVDATIATMFCNGLANMQSMGIGGGFLMTIYIREEKRAYALNAREFAPLEATPQMYKGHPDKTKNGPLAVGVPGELKGYWSAHQRFGKLPWKDLVQPTIDLCERGYNLSKPQHKSVVQYTENLSKDSNMKTWFFNADGKSKPVGSQVIPTKLCETLKIVAEKGAEDLYNGSLAKKFVEDLQEAGGIITLDDMRNYTVKWMEPISAKFNNGDQLHSSPLPGCGTLLAFILNILDGYNFTREAIDGTPNTVLTYHRIIEAFKYAYARRSELGDPGFVDVKELMGNLTSHEYAERIRRKINDTSTSNDAKKYGGVFFSNDDHGTAHISVLAENGDAVSVTSTVNIYFGAGFTSKQTGILYNSGMDDFSFPDFVNYFGVPGSPNNAMRPGKRSLSSMSPSIITNKEGDVVLVIGASGGTKITSSVALVIMRVLWFGQNVKEAVDAPRIHHQLFPMEIAYEYGNIDGIVKGLEALGHNMKRFMDGGSVICAIHRNEKRIYANADFRKGGMVFGID